MIQGLVQTLGDLSPHSGWTQSRYQPDIATLQVGEVETLGEQPWRALLGDQASKFCAHSLANDVLVSCR